MKDHYQTLGITPDSEEIVVRAAYNALVKKYHPDTFNGDKQIAEAKTKAINVAYATLRDSVKRAAYDLELNRTKQPRQSAQKSTSASSGQSGHASDSTASRKQEANTAAARRQPFFLFLPLDRRVVGYALAGLAIVVLLNFIDKAPTKDGPSSSATNLTAIQPVQQAVTNGSSAERLAIPAKIDWDARKAGDPKSYFVGNFAITLSSEKSEDKSYPAPVLDVDLKGIPHLHFVGQPGFETAAARVQVIKLNKDDENPAVIFMTYSGGAHCCTGIDIFTAIGSQWKHAETGGDGGPPDEFPKDVNADGRLDIELTDGRFNYTFDAYSNSDAPPAFFNVVDGKLKDVSADPSFWTSYKDVMIGDQADCLLRSNGGCAAFVAAASRLGLYDWAWQFMLANYDASSGWVYPKKCDIDTHGLPCPADHQTESTFPDALKQFLIDAGYDNENAHNVFSSFMTSFDCARISSSVLKLVCNSPGLAASDRTLAAAYFAVGHINGAPLDLKEDELNWIRIRNNSEPDLSTLQHLYDQRIAYLTQLARELAVRERNGLGNP